MNINIKYTTKTILVLLSAFVFSPLYAADGDVFTAKTVEGIDLTFKVISEAEKTCQVGEGIVDSQAILNSTIGAVTIPSSVNGYSVTSIGKDAFYRCSGLTSITIPNSVTSIGSSAFEGCIGLTSFTIPNSVTSIESFTFDHCSSLTSITIPSSVTSIEYYVFTGCSGLTSIKVDSNNKVYDSRNNCNAIIETASNTMITGCMNTIIPNSVTSIESLAFLECNGLTNITIPNSVISIGNSAFYGCSGLTSITIPISVTSIENGAFHGCSGLTSIKVDSNNKLYDSRDNCNAIIQTASNTMITGCMNTIIPNSVTSIGSYAFYGCSGLTNITIPNSVTSIGSSAFKNCIGLTSIIIPSSVTNIDYYVFENCSSLTNIKVDSNNKVYDSRDNCNAIIQTASNTLIAGCMNTIIPNSVTSIGSYAFYGCSGLTNITIPNSVTTVGKWAFYGCSGLTSIISYIEDLFTIDDNVFSSYDSSLLMVPYGTKAKYETTDGWKNFKNIKEMDIIFTVKTVEGIDLTFKVINKDDKTCQLGTGMKCAISKGGNIVIPDNANGYTVIKIGDNALLNCIDMTSISIPSSVIEIGNNVFVGCTGLEHLIVDGENQVYDSRDNCNALIETATNTLMVGCKNTVIPSTIMAIKDLAFYGCSGLTSITIPYSVTNIGKDVFAGCSGLTDISVESNNQVYDSRDNCNAIIETATNTLMVGCQNTVIPSTMTAIGERACYGVLGLTAMTLPATLRSIGEEAFANTDDLAHVTSEITEPFAIPATAFVHSNGEAPTLYIPIVTKEKYLAAEGWNQFDKKIETAPEGTEFAVDVNGVKLNFKVTNQEKRTCQLGLQQPNETLKKAVHVTIPTEVRDQTVTAIRDYAFANCSELLSLSFPETIEMVGEHVLDGCSSLAAIQWKAEKTIPTSLTAGISNPNLLLYVKNKDYAPATIQNVVENGVAENIVLKEAANDNNFYCMEAFTAKNITFTHNYSMTSGYKVCQGWETIALPFDVTSIIHESFAELVPITTWEIGSNKRPFWLYEQTVEGWKSTTAINANTPYIICLPNNLNQYDPIYCTTGNVTFRGKDVQVPVSSQLIKNKYGERTFVPNFVNTNAASDVYALNVNNEWDKYDYTTYLQGSTFLSNFRAVHPFEAYMTMEGGVAASEFIPIFENGTTGISDAMRLNDKSKMANEKWYTLDGRKLQQQPERKGLYIVNGHKVVIK